MQYVHRARGCCPLPLAHSWGTPCCTKSHKIPSRHLWETSAARTPTSHHFFTKYLQNRAQRWSWDFLGEDLNASLRKKGAMLRKHKYSQCVSTSNEGRRPQFQSLWHPKWQPSCPQKRSGQTRAGKVTEILKKKHWAQRVPKDCFKAIPGPQYLIKMHPRGKPTWTYKYIYIYIYIYI